MADVRIPRQARGIKTKSRIMKAAFQLVAQKGIHGTNSNEIAKKAGVSTGSFYSYFKNKKMLLLEMLEDYLDRHYMTIWKQLNTYQTDALGADDIKSLISNTFEAYNIAPKFHRQTHALRYSDPDVNRIYERERNREIEQIRFLIERNNIALSIKDPHAAAIVLHNTVENVAHTVKFIGTEVEEERLVNTLCELIYSFFAKNAS